MTNRTKQNVAVDRNTFCFDVEFIIDSPVIKSPFEGGQIGQRRFALFIEPRGNFTPLQRLSAMHCSSNRHRSLSSASAPLSKSGASEAEIGRERDCIIDLDVDPLRQSGAYMTGSNVERPSGVRISRN